VKYSSQNASGCASGPYCCGKCRSHHVGQTIDVSILQIAVRSIGEGDIQPEGARGSDRHRGELEEMSSRVWIGRIMSALPALFLLVDGAMKLAKPAFVVDATVQLGYPTTVVVPLGVVLLVCTLLYVVPRTAFVGAILLTGYLGGAVATQVRVGAGLFPVLFPVALGILLWGGLLLRDERVAAAAFCR